MGFDSLLEQVQKEENLLRQEKENEKRDLLTQIQSSISYNVRQLYGLWSKQLAQTFLQEKKSTIRVPFPATIPMYPNVEYKGSQDILADLNVRLFDPSGGDCSNADHLLIVLIHTGQEYKKTDHFFTFIEQMKKIAAPDEIQISDIICEEHSYEFSLAGSSKPRINEIPLYEANDFKRSKFNKHKRFSYRLFVELTTQSAF